MSTVTDPSIRLVFCEGHSGSLDVELLMRFIPIGKAEIRPVGGKSSMRAFIQGHMSNYSSQPDKCPTYLGFRDRDFDIEPPDKPGLIPMYGTTPIWLTYRACVESYFIDSQLLHDYWLEHCVGPQWQHGSPLPVDVIETKIIESARELADYQAIRWALSKMKPGTRWPEILTTWTDGSGYLPFSLSFPECLDQAMKLVDNFVKEVSVVTVDKLSDAVQDYRRRFTQDEFYSEQFFLVWFHGKDLLANLSRYLAPNFPRKHYAKWAANHVSLSSHPDLQNLADICST